MENKKQIFVKIELDSETDEFLHIITTEGFDDTTPNQTSREIIANLEILKQKELKKLLEFGE